MMKNIITPEQKSKGKKVLNVLSNVQKVIAIPMMFL
jgi:hypothetical protein